MSARGVEVFRRFFEKIVEQCQQAGLVWGKELYVNATKVKANASLDSLTPRFAVEAHLSTLFAEEAEPQGNFPFRSHSRSTSNSPKAMLSVMIGSSKWERKIAALRVAAISASLTYA